MKLDTYKSVKRLYRRGHTEMAIAAQLKMSRGAIQRRCWIMKMSTEIQDIEKWYLEGKLHDLQLIGLFKAFNRGTLKEEWRLIVGGKVCREYYTRRPVGEIRRAMQSTKNKKVRETLEWVLNQRETLQ